MGHVFISYQAEDREFAAAMARQIEDAGFPVWSDTQRFHAGEKWREAVDQAIREAFVLLVVLTPDVKASEQITYEWTFALGGGVRVIAVIYRPTGLPARLEGLSALDFTDRAALPWGKLIRLIQEARDHERPASFGSRPAERPATPFGARRPFGTPENPPGGGLLDRIRRREGFADDEELLEPGQPPDSIPRLIDALDSDNRDLRMSAARQLGEIGDRSAVPALIKLLRDEDWRVRDAAAAALGKLKAAAAVVGLLETLRMGRPGPFGGGPNNAVITAAIKDIGALAVPVLIDALDDEDWRIRLYATEALGQIGEAEAIPALTGVLRDPEWRVRWRAAEALGKAGNLAALPDLAGLLRDDSKDVRIAAAWALGRIGDPLPVPGLVRLLYDRDWRVRWAAAEALWCIGAEAVPALVEVLREPAEYVRRVAIRALAEIGEPAIPVLIGALGDADWDVRWAAAAALQDMGARAVPPLIDALTSEDWQASWAAAETLKRIDTPEARTAVEDWRGEHGETDQPAG